MKRILLVAVVIYLLGYLALRLLNAEVWETDGNTYVIFPREPIALYYIYRPMTYLDAALTGMRFHIGPHQ
ncbi:MAG: hypothetical protein NXI27_10495 [Alphaproteobacteria bacterium]|nr:hypothetical protein [Alphaproteobacteria bacterium]